MARTRRARGGASKGPQSEGILAEHGLAVVDIPGDGNCLFSALSDQVHGTPAQAANVRQSCIRYMREHADHFKKFIEVHPGGGTRRNPKRKNVACVQVNVPHAPTDEERNRAFDNHLSNMAQPGTWGGHLEITAFVGAYSCRVNIWQAHIVYDVGGVDPSLGTLPPEPQVAHIFYHADFEHYSSVRNVSGPFEGMPNITCNIEYSSEPSSQQSMMTDASKVEDWRKQVVHDSLNFEASDNQVAQALLSTSGDVDGAVTKLMESQFSPSPASTPGSSSVERDHDDDETYTPNKRQDRRLSHATRAMMQRSHRQKLAAAISSIPDRDSPIPSDTGSFRPERRESETSMSTSVSASASQKVEPTESSQADTSQESGLAAGPAKPIRLKINNNTTKPDPPHDSHSNESKGKTSQSQTGQSPGQRKTPSARDRKELKKQAQKQARKERARSEAAEKGLPIMTKSERAPFTAIKL